MKPDDKADRTWELLGHLFKTHPWHGVPIGDDAPGEVTVYVEIVPQDAVKYEVDKQTGHLKVDRPQRFSSVCPSLYGFIPRTYCGDRVAELARRRTGRASLDGDADPLDICVLSEKAFSHGDFLLKALPVGGLRMIDKGQADDKIVAVLEGDVAYGRIQDLDEVPRPLLDRLEHYFLTYKLAPGVEAGAEDVTVDGFYGRDEAREVITRSAADYRTRFPDLRRQLLAALQGE
jgi:inorganic pyrophosphatase